MSVPTITRDADTDDDGSGTTGTVRDNAWKTAIYNRIDALIVALIAAVTTWSAKQTFSVAPQVPSSAGTAVFGLDCTDTAVFNLANNGTTTPFGNANNFSGLIIVDETLFTGEVALFLVGAVIHLTDQSITSYTTTATTANKINVYLNSGVLTIENKTGSTTSFRVLALRTRTSA